MRAWIWKAFPVLFLLKEIFKFKFRTDFSIDVCVSLSASDYPRPLTLSAVVSLTSDPRCAFQDGKEEEEVRIELEQGGERCQAGIRVEFKPGKEKLVSL